MGRRLIDMTGQKFGRLTVQHRIEKPGNTFWLCTCECGTETEVAGGLLRNGNTSSCGCLRREISAETCKSAATHGRTNTPTWNSWQSMRDRCLATGNKDFPSYGGRGIAVCERWASFSNFIADMGERPEGMSLDRIDVNGNYEPTNCRWATPYQQTHNVRWRQGLDPDRARKVKEANEKRNRTSWRNALSEAQKRRWARWRAERGTP